MLIGVPAGSTVGETRVAVAPVASKQRLSTGDSVKTQARCWRGHLPTLVGVGALGRTSHRSFISAV